MDRLWTPWRYNYVSRADSSERKGVPEELAAWPGDHNCVFCNLISSVDHAISTKTPQLDAEKAALILWRGDHNFLCLNRYPYASGHVLIVPYQHLDSLAKLPAPAAQELIHLAQVVENALRSTYTPDGINLGMNLGESAGAGVANHLHLHALPRWSGDTNFLTTIAETRVIPEDLHTTWSRLRSALP